MTRENLTLQVNLDARTGPAVSAAVRDWFTGCFETLGRELRERVLAAAPFPQSAVTTRKPEEPYGSPGEPWAHFVVGKATRTGTIRRRATAFSLAGYETFLRDASELPESATFLVATIDEWGYLEGLPFLNMELERSTKDRDWLFLVAEFPRSLLSEPATEHRMVAWLRTFADRHAPGYAGIDNQFGLYRTKLEDDLGLIPNKTVLTCREKLRGSSWITICDEQIVHNVGGEQALVDSGAFDSVVTLGHGGYWLQATDSFATYGQAQAERVAGVLSAAT